MGSENHFYDVYAESSFRAAWDALQRHEAHQPRVGDDTVVRVVVDGNNSMLYDYLEHDEGQPNYRHRVGRLREWAHRQTCPA
jgi:hypothetical protein